MFDPSKAIKKMLGPGTNVPRYKQGKSTKDSDGDGINDIMDCQPKNMFRQDIYEIPGALGEKFFTGYWRSIEGSTWLNIPKDTFGRNYKLWEKIIPGRKNAYILAIPEKNKTWFTTYFEQSREKLGTTETLSNHKVLGSSLSLEQVKNMLKTR